MKKILGTLGKFQLSAVTFLVAASSVFGAGAARSRNFWPELEPVY
jgi:hypothetical protein